MKVGSLAVALMLSLASLAPSLAHAGPESFGLGDGHDGDLVVTRPGVSLNGYSALTAALAPGARRVLVQDSAPFAPGRLVLLWQTALAGAVPSGSQQPLDAEALGVGQWELARVASVEPGALLLEGPVERSYAARGAQAISVPEYRSLRVEQGAGLVPGRAWDGRAGGVLALLVQGAASLDGSLGADGAGFRGGVFVNEPVYTHVGCTELDTTEPGTDGARGEGLYLDAFGERAAGRGNVANGAGGGDCKNAGGAGGGNAGPGGSGGRSYSDGARPVGGMPGVAVRCDPTRCALFGGGGGAGHGNDRAATDGGSGGGWVFLLAGSVLGRGGISANGAMPPVPNQYGQAPAHDGQGGGGAGGSLYVRVAGALECVALRAEGANGLDAPLSDHGPGGGGGGGLALVQSGARGAGCLAAVRAGVAGVQTDPALVDGPHFGATPTQPDDPSARGALVELPGPYAWAPALDAGADAASAPLDASAAPEGPGAEPTPARTGAGCACGVTRGGAGARRGLLLLLGALLAASRERTRKRS